MTREESSGRFVESSTAGFGIAVGIGLVASSLHWVGLLLGGILVGLLAPTTRRGIGYGALWGAFAWLVFVGLLATNGIAPTVDTGHLFGVSLGAAVGLGAIGGSARELRPLVSRLSPARGG